MSTMALSIVPSFAASPVSLANKAPILKVKNLLKSDRLTNVTSSLNFNKKPTQLALQPVRVTTSSLSPKKTSYPLNNELFKEQNPLNVNSKLLINEPAKTPPTSTSSMTTAVTKIFNQLSAMLHNSSWLKNLAALGGCLVLISPTGPLGLGAVLLFAILITTLSL